MKIKSLAEYITVIDDLKKKYTFEKESSNILDIGVKNHVPQFVFRGHSNAQFKLLPGIFRWRQITSSKSCGEYSQMEANILREFISDACRYMNNINSNDMVVWLEIAQHFGVPTRLLDFTSNPLVALYFACTENTEYDGTVWIINQDAYNMKFFNISTEVESTRSDQFVWEIVNKEIINQDYLPHTDSNYVQYPWIYKPVNRAERMSTQSSIFMIWGADRREFPRFLQSENYMTINEETVNKQEGIVCNIDIDAADKNKIIKELDLCGINEKFIYPGLDGIGKYVKQKFSTRDNLNG